MDFFTSIDIFGFQHRYWEYALLFGIFGFVLGWWIGVQNQRRTFFPERESVLGKAIQVGLGGGLFRPLTLILLVICLILRIVSLFKKEGANSEE